MATQTYRSGESALRLLGHAADVLPHTEFEHDFSVDGPEGEHGPAREAAMIASGAIAPVVPEIAAAAPQPEGEE